MHINCSGIGYEWPNHFVLSKVVLTCTFLEKKLLIYYEELRNELTLVIKALLGGQMPRVTFYGLWPRISQNHEI